MSFYATIQGSVTFPDKAALDKVVQDLNTRYWMRGENFVDDGEHVVNETASDVEGLTLKIPLATYNKLVWHLNKVSDGGSEYRFVWTSTDGMERGGVIVDGTEKEWDLKEWAKENMPEEDATPPGDFDEYCQWLSEVELAFHTEMA